MEMEKKRLYDSDVFIAYVRIATPSQIRTAVAGSKLKSSNTNLITRITANYNGIVAVNGDFYSNSEKKGGYMVRQKEVFREKVSNNYDLLVIDELGDFHILMRGKETQQNGIATLQNDHEIVNCFFFGPALVVDGEVQGADTYDDYAFDPTQPNPPGSHRPDRPADLRSGCREWPHLRNGWRDHGTTGDHHGRYRLPAGL